jgi:hemerythrin superfamily protein
VLFGAHVRQSGGLEAALARGEAWGLDVVQAWVCHATYQGTSGRMNALTVLKQDHQNVEALFERFEKAGPNAHKEAARIVEKIIEHLSVHAVIEEQVVYPAVRERMPDENDTVLEALEEHHAVKSLLAEIDRAAPTNERFRAKVQVVIEQVRHHVEEEENELFPKIREAFTVEELEQMGEALQQAKEVAPTRPHPHTPDQPPANILLGLPVALLDRALTTGKQAMGKLLNRR